jgi:hypothetical protein
MLKVQNYSDTFVTNSKMEYMKKKLLTLFFVIACCNIYADTCSRTFIHKGTPTRGGVNAMADIVNNEMKLWADISLINSRLEIVDSNGNIMQIDDISYLMSGQYYYVDLSNLENGEYTINLIINNVVYTGNLTID